MFAPRTIPMPDPAWGMRKDHSRPGFARALTARDLALDPQAVLMQGNAHDGIAAALVDAEEEAKRDRIVERTDARAWDVARERRAPWDVAASYVHPDMPRDVSTGPGAFTRPEPDIVPHLSSQDTRRTAASAPLWVRNGGHGGACPLCGSALQCACAWGDARGREGGVGGGLPQAPVRLAATDVARLAQAFAYGQAQAQAHAQAQAQAQTQRGMTAPGDDEATAFMVSSYAPGASLHTTTPRETLMHNAHAARAARRRVGGCSGSVRAMRAGLPSDAEARTWGLGGAAEGFGAGAGFGVSLGTSVPAYDTPDPPPGATLGAPDRWGLYAMPGGVRTTAELLRRDAAVQRVAWTPDGNVRAAPFADATPFTDALGFRYADRAQFRFDRPKFFPARDPLDKLLYEQAAEVAPDVSADAQDHAFFRSVEGVPEPLDARWEMMRAIARDTPHTRDPYLVPRTGPSVLHPGQMAQPPDWRRMHTQDEW